jgi:hypothetical protein
MRVAFYVSGHGYGHAVRMAEVMKALAAEPPGIRIFVRSAAPEFLFPPQVSYSAADFDAGVAETPDTLRILPGETASRLGALMDRAGQIVAREIEWTRAHGIELLIADIPFLAGEIAAGAGIPCFGISNFTWDWIYEPHLAGDARWPEWERRIRGAYARFSLFLKLPFAQNARLDAFAAVREVPLIASPSAGAESNGTGPLRVLIAMRGEIPVAAVRRAARQAPEFRFVHRKAELEAEEPNLEYSSAPFHDLLAQSDVIVSKPGYSTIAECVAHRKRFLYTPRSGFREDPVSLAEASAYIPLAEIPLEDFHTGAWAEHLRRLLALPKPTAVMRADGSACCAEVIRKWEWPA